jgi:hypothetical protein
LADVEGSDLSAPESRDLGRTTGTVRLNDRCAGWDVASEPLKGEDLWELNHLGVELASVAAWDVSAIKWLDDESAIGTEVNERNWEIKIVCDIVFFESALISAEIARILIDLVCPGPVVVPQVLLVEEANVS